MVTLASSNENPVREYHVGKPNVGDRELFDRMVAEMFERQWFTNNGPLVRQFESEICKMLGVKHCIAVCNATIGLQLACRALNLKGEVLVPAYTFVASAHSMYWEGVRPVFVDVDATSHCIDVDKIEESITDQTSAIVPVHLWGNACQVERIDQIARNNNLKVIYDAAHAFACQHAGRMIGNFGDCEVFSFHATKFVQSFEGGAITTNDDSLAAQLKQLRNFGFSGPDNVASLGTNAKMSEVCAAMGITNLASVDRFIEVNRNNQQQYDQLLREIPGISLMQFDHLESCNWQYVVVEVDESKFGMSRDQLLEHLHGSNVLARRYFFPGCSNMEPYRSLDPIGKNLPVTSKLCNSVICLPNGTSLCSDDIKFITDLISSLV